MLAHHSNSSPEAILESLGACIAVGQSRTTFISYCALFLNFDGHCFERLVAEVLFGMLDGRSPRDVTSFVLYGLDLARGVGGPEILIGEKDSDAIRRMRVHGSYSVWLDHDPQNPHLGVFKF